MGFVTIKDQDGVEHTIHASQLQAPNQTLTVTYSCPDCDKLRADLAAAQMELAAWEQATHEGIDGKWLAEDIWARVAELLAQEGVPAQPQYREPTIEDAREIANDKGRYFCMGDIADRLKQLGFYRKVQP